MFFKDSKFLPLLALPFLAWLLPVFGEKNPPEGSGHGPGDFSPQKINLALRRTADGLLRDAGDGRSRVPAVEQVGPKVWRVRLDRAFRYDTLPALLENSLAQYGIRQAYEVSVRRCDSTDVIDLGYHKLDFVNTGTVPCQGRETPPGCRFIEISFLENGAAPMLSRAGKAAVWGLFLLGWAAFWFFRKPKTAPAEPAPETGSAWLAFGNSRLDADGQVLDCGGVREKLTFREAKLLRLFAENPGRLLERENILRQVWADEGVLVGRSVDMFVSRLRKKLAADGSVRLVAVHGVGYRLEIENLGR